ncbi:hypothetical protein CMUS01_04596 [Colletotrichum musicola]|uniref:Uncharacterized protein n=1 Tax=Colletotrichum musicola TaxID=2175873 RepID=A0A8H6KWH1_9PEZI|nr:hypothetical protein CMUS01_04596 [Colletotrichum musicola]
MGVAQSLCHECTSTSASATPVFPAADGPIQVPLTGGAGGTGHLDSLSERLPRTFYPRPTRKGRRGCQHITVPEKWLHDGHVYIFGRVGVRSRSRAGSTPVAEGGIGTGRGCLVGADKQAGRGPDGRYDDTTRGGITDGTGGKLEAVPGGTGGRADGAEYGPHKERHRVFGVTGDGTTAFGQDCGTRVLGSGRLTRGRRRGLLF